MAILGGPMLCRRFSAALLPDGSAVSCRHAAIVPLAGSSRSCHFSAAAPLVGSAASCRRAAAARLNDRIRWMVFQNRSLDVLIDRQHPNAVRPPGRAARSVALDWWGDPWLLAGRSDRLGPPDLPLRYRGEPHSGHCPKGVPVLNPVLGCRNPRFHAGAENQTEFEGP